MVFDGIVIYALFVFNQLDLLMYSIKCVVELLFTVDTLLMITIEENWMLNRTVGLMILLFG